RRSNEARVTAKSKPQSSATTRCGAISGFRKRRGAAKPRLGSRDRGVERRGRDRDQETGMFTGIVSDIGTVIGVTERNDVRRIAIACSFAPDTITIGASISCAGICMTVIAREDAGAGKAAVEFEAGPETLVTTSVREWDVGR